MFYKNAAQGLKLLYKRNSDEYLFIRDLFNKLSPLHGVLISTEVITTWLPTLFPKFSWLYKEFKASMKEIYDIQRPVKYCYRFINFPESNYGRKNRENTLVATTVHT